MVLWFYGFMVLGSQSPRKKIEKYLLVVNMTEPCPLSFSIGELGLYGQPSYGCFCDDEWLSSLVAPLHSSRIHPSLYIDLPHKKLHYLRTVAHGKFGYIDMARYETGGEVTEVYVKRPIPVSARPREIVYEACIQTIVRNTFLKAGFSSVCVPRVLDIFQLHSGWIGFSMEQIHGAVALTTWLQQVREEKDDLSELFMEILLQAVGMVWNMNRVGVNHRDLKPSNFLIHQGEQRAYRLEVEGRCIGWVSSYYLTLIDFGFACVGSIQTHQAHVSLGTVYSSSDPCPKEGRDLYLFLGLLYTDYYSHMSSGLALLFESWLEVAGSNLCSFMRRDGENAKMWLYFLTGSEQVKQLHCHPVRILHDLVTWGAERRRTF
jgi:serine/threonine protein kinase